MDTLPRSLMGSAWAPQKERIDAGIYFLLFIVVAKHDRSAPRGQLLACRSPVPADVPGTQTSSGDGPVSRVGGLHPAPRLASRPPADTGNGAGLKRICGRLWITGEIVL